MYWELLKMEIRCFTIKGNKKRKVKETRNRELIIKVEMDRLDHIICSNSDITSVDEELTHYDILKRNFNKYMKTKVKPESFDPNACGLKRRKTYKIFFQCYHC